MNNIYVAGKQFYYLDPTTLVNIALLKYDTNGNQIWNTTLNTGGPNANVDVIAVQLDTFGNIFVEANFEGEGIPYMTFKLNSAGSGGLLQGDPTDNGGSAAAGIAVDALGNVFVTGENAHYPPLPSYGTYKIDTNGTYLWAALYPMSSYGSSGASAIALDSADDVYVTGNSTITNTGSDIATIKYDSNGKQIWVQRYDGPGHGNDAGNAIAVDNSGNVYVAGYETETNGFTSMILIKYSPVTVQKQPNGNFTLQTFGSPGQSFDIQASTNLQTWQDLGAILADTNGLLQFIDTNTSLFPARFYSAVPK